METWYRKTLGAGVASAAPSRRIQSLFPSLFVAAGQPGAMAVFSRYDRGTDEVTAYFSPAACELAALFGAKPCAKPPGEGIGLLVGAARSWGLLFPDRVRRRATRAKS